MAKKKKTKPKKKVNPEKTHLETLLLYTVRQITGLNDSLDQLFTGQAAKIRERLKSL